MDLFLLSEERQAPMEHQFLLSNCFLKLEELSTVTGWTEQIPTISTLSLLYSHLGAFSLLITMRLVF